MSVVQKTDEITPDEYLQSELISEIKHELIDGYAYAMAGASKNHGRISANLMYQLVKHLKVSTCEPFGSDMKVRVDSNFFYPDVIVVCDDRSDNDYYTDSPIIIVEVVRRSDDWRSKRYYMGDEITFDSIGLTIAVEEIYLRVQNEDVATYLAKKEEEARLAAE